MPLLSEVAFARARVRIGLARVETWLERIATVPKSAFARTDERLTAIPESIKTSL